MKKTTTYKCFRNIVVFDLTHVGEREIETERDRGRRYVEKEGEGD